MARRRAALSGAAPRQLWEAGRQPGGGGCNRPFVRRRSCWMDGTALGAVYTETSPKRSVYATMSHYHIIACQVLWREICHFASLSQHEFTFTFLRQGLHNTPDLLRERLQATIDAAEEELTPGAILLGYGLCCNGIAGIRARRAPLVAVRAHDCITFLLGSKERYRDYFDTHPGTYWYSTGWNETGTMPSRERLERQRKDYVERFGEDDAEYLIEMEQAWVRNYSAATYVDMGLGDAAEGKSYTARCAAELGWNYAEIKGSARLLAMLVAGDWPAADFLVVQPGQQIAPSHDHDVIRIG